MYRKQYTVIHVCGTRNTRMENDYVLDSYRLLMVSDYIQKLKAVINS